MTDFSYLGTVGSIKLYACLDCGVVVADAQGINIHQQWHEDND